MLRPGCGGFFMVMIVFFFALVVVDQFHIESIFSLKIGKCASLPAPSPTRNRATRP